MNRLERLINLVAALLEAERPLTAEEIRERVPGYPDEQLTFRRAFERDKEALREMGIPVVLEPLASVDPPIDGYRIPKDAYYLQDPGLASDELAALHLAATAVDIEGANGVEALWKLGGEVAEAGPVPARAALPGAAHLSALFAAISDRRSVSFDYRGRPRTIDPYRLSFRNGHWYLGGRDHQAGEMRSYRLDRVESAVTVVGEAGGFEPQPMALADAPPWQLGDADAIVATLLVDADQAGWAVSNAGPDARPQWRDDGSVVLEFRVTNREAFRSFVLGFLDHAEILGPPELRSDMVDWLQELGATT